MPRVRRGGLEPFWFLAPGTGGRRRGAGEDMGEGVKSKKLVSYGVAPTIMSRKGSLIRCCLFQCSFRLTVTQKKRSWSFDRIQVDKKAGSLIHFIVQMFLREGEFLRSGWGLNVVLVTTSNSGPLTDEMPGRITPANSKSRPVFRNNGSSVACKLFRMRHHSILMGACIPRRQMLEEGRMALGKGTLRGR